MQVLIPKTFKKRLIAQLAKSTVFMEAILCDTYVPDTDHIVVLSFLFNKTVRSIISIEIKSPKTALFQREIYFPVRTIIIGQIVVAKNRVPAIRIWVE